MNPAQCRMARAGLGLSLVDLGKSAGVRTMTISKFERGLTVVPERVEALRAALVSQGAEFINGGKSVGVRVPRVETLAERQADLKQAQAAHRKVRRLIGAKKPVEHNG